MSRPVSAWAGCLWLAVAGSLWSAESPNPPTRQAPPTRQTPRDQPVAPEADRPVGGAGTPWAAERDTPAGDPRSIELLRRDCRSEIGRQEVTLFANGTVRLREGIPQNPKMTLAELDPERLAGYERRLAAEDLSEVEKEAAGGVVGDWVEQCQLSLLQAGRPRIFLYARYDALPLNLSRVVTIADDIAREVDPRASMQHLPLDYVPRTGDVLRRMDGELFQIVGQTADKQGYELSGVVTPLTLYMPKSELGREFIALESRRSAY